MPDKGQAHGNIPRASSILLSLPTRLTCQGMQRAVRTVRGFPTFWEAVERGFQVDPTVGDLQVLPWRVLDGCERRSQQ